MMKQTILHFIFVFAEKMNYVFRLNMCKVLTSLTMLCGINHLPIPVKYNTLLLE